MRPMRWTMVLVSLLAAVTVAGAKPDHGNRGQDQQDQDRQPQQQQGNRGRGQDRRRQQQAQQRQQPQGRSQWQDRSRRVDDRTYGRSNRRSRGVDRPQSDRQVDRRRTTYGQQGSQSQPRYRSGTTVSPRSVWPRFRATNWRSEHQTWGQRGGYNGYRMPVSRFNLYFGRHHHYRLSRFAVQVFDDQPAFYSYGYWIVLLDPVPEYWDPDWYDVDYVRIVELDDGYYLLNESDPDVLLAVDIRAG